MSNLTNSLQSIQRLYDEMGFGRNARKKIQRFKTNRQNFNNSRYTNHAKFFNDILKQMREVVNKVENGGKMCNKEVVVKRKK